MFMLKALNSRLHNYNNLIHNIDINAIEAKRRKKLVIKRSNHFSRNKQRFEELSSKQKSAAAMTNNNKSVEATATQPQLKSISQQEY